LQTPLIAVGEPQATASSETTQTSGEKVGQYAIPVDTEFGTVEVYESLVEKGHWYVGPIFRFKLVDSKNNLISRVSDTLTPGVKSVELSLELVTPDILAQVREQLSSDGHLVKDVGNLRLYRIIVDLRSESIKKALAIVPLKIDNPAFGQSFPVTFEVQQDKADKFSDLINSGSIDFNITFQFNEIKTDIFFSQLDASVVRQSKTYRDLKQKGQELMTADQAADSVSSISRDLSATTIQGLGEIVPSTMNVTQLLQNFRVPDTVSQDDASLADLDKRLYNQLDLKINSADFQPFRVQKQVAEILNEQKDVATQRKKYAEAYQSNKSKWNASAGFSYMGLGASGRYAAEAAKANNSNEMSDDQFKDFLKTYHGLQYNTEERLFRGVAIYDLQKLEQEGNYNVTSVTIKPILSDGVRTVAVRASANEAIAREETVNTVNVLVPIGTVIAWSGNWNDIQARPKNFELCDGKKPSTPGAIYKGEKPNLIGRFPRGMRVNDGVPFPLESGGPTNNRPSSHLPDKWAKHRREGLVGSILYWIWSRLLERAR
jgi:hypothetical protein